MNIRYGIDINVNSSQAQKAIKELQKDIKGLTLDDGLLTLEFDAKTPDFSKLQGAIGKIREAFPSLTDDFNISVLKKAITGVKSELHGAGYVLEKEFNVSSIREEILELQNVMKSTKHNDLGMIDGTDEVREFSNQINFLKGALFELAKSGDIDVSDTRDLLIQLDKLFGDLSADSRIDFSPLQNELKVIKEGVDSASETILNQIKVLSQLEDELSQVSKNEKPKDNMQSQESFEKVEQEIDNIIEKIEAINDAIYENVTLPLEQAFQTDVVKEWEESVINSINKIRENLTQTFGEDRGIHAAYGVLEEISKLDFSNLNSFTVLTSEQTVDKLKQIKDSVGSYSAQNIDQSNVQLASPENSIENINEELDEAEGHASNLDRLFSQIGLGSFEDSSRKANEQLKKEEQIADNIIASLDEEGLSYKELLKKIQKENEEVLAGNKAFKERLVYLDKTGKVLKSYFGDEFKVNDFGMVSDSASGISAAKILHTHSDKQNFGGAFSLADMAAFIEANAKNDVKEIELRWRNQVLNLDVSGMTDYAIDQLAENYSDLYSGIIKEFGVVGEDGKRRIPPELAQKASDYMNSLFQEMLIEAGGQLTSTKKYGRLSNNVKKSILRKTDSAIDEELDQFEAEVGYKEDLDPDAYTRFYGEVESGAMTASKAIKEFNNVVKDIETPEIVDEKLLSDNVSSITEEYQKIEQSATTAAQAEEKLAEAEKHINESNISIPKVKIDETLNTSEAQKDAKEQGEKLGEIEGKAIEKGVRDSTQVNSPSPLFIEIGKWIGKSLNIGIDQSLDETCKTTQDWVNKIVEILELNGVNLSDDIISKLSSGYKNFVPTQELNRTMSSMRGVKSIIKNGFPIIDSGNKAAIKEIDDAYKVLIKDTKRYKELEIITENGNRGTKNQIAQFFNLSSSVSKANDTLKEYSEEERNASKYAEQWARESEEVKYQIENLQLGGVISQLSKYSEQAKKLSEDRRIAEDSRKLLSSLSTEGVELLTNFDISDLNTAKTLIDRLKSSIDEVNKVSAQISLNKLGANVADMLNKNSAMSKELKNEFRSLLIDINNMADAVKNGVSVSDEQIRAFSLRFTDLERRMNSAGKTGKSFWQRMTDDLRNANAQLLRTYFSWMDIIRYGREVVNVITELDTGLTELRKVSDATDERLSQSFKNSAATAKELGSTITDVINSTSDWARLGFDVDAAEELARVTTLYQNVGDGINQEEASESLVSTMQGFEIAYTEAEDIIDKFNEVSNNFAISSGGIGEALKRSAASFNAANTDLSESIALVTATNAVVQDPDAVGTMWKTVSARIRGAKTELEDMGEDTEGMVESTSKLRDLVKGMTGFDIMEDENTFKSIYDIIVGIGEKWQDLNDIDQAALLEALAGKRAGNSLAAALNNVEDLKKAYETAENSAGSAAKEQENYEKSIQYSLDRLAASAQEWAYDITNSDVIKWFIDLANAIVKVSDAITPLGTLLVGGGLFAGIKNFGKPKSRRVSKYKCFDVAESMYGFSW